MVIPTWRLAMLGAILTIGLSGLSDAQARHVYKPHHEAGGSRETLDSRAPHRSAGSLRFLETQIGQFYLAPGDSEAVINRAYPVDANPPSLRQSYNLRWRKMQEFRR